MLRSSLLAFCILCAAVFMGCGKTETMSNNSKTAENSNKSATAGTTTKETTASAGEKIGVPECDEFIAKYEACVSNKVPAMVRAQYQNSLKQWRASWKKLAESPNTKPTLAAACKQAAEQQEVALKAYGCKW